MTLSKINKIALMTIAIMAIVALSLGLIIPAIFSTELLPFFLIIIAEAIYIGCMFVLLGYSVKKIIQQVMQ